jgi:chromosome transmission fidelity protein 18
MKRRKADATRSKAVAAITRGAKARAAATGGDGGVDAAATVAGGGGGAGKAAAAAAAVAGPGSHVVLFKFNEGYTNAVKRPLLVKELLDL